MSIKTIETWDTEMTPPPRPVITYMREPSREQVDTWANGWGNRSNYYLIITDSTPRDRIQEDMNDYSYLSDGSSGYPSNVSSRIATPFWNDNPEAINMHVERTAKFINKAYDELDRVVWKYKELDL